MVLIRYRIAGWMIAFEANRSFAMSRQDQIALLKRLLHYVDTRTTAMAEAPWLNDVSVYADPERLTTQPKQK